MNPAHSLAILQVDYSFTGRSSHAAAAPELGRSALDAAELMNVANVDGSLVGGASLKADHFLAIARACA